MAVAPFQGKREAMHVKNLALGLDFLGTGFGAGCASCCKPAPTTCSAPPSPCCGPTVAPRAAVLVPPPGATVVPAAPQPVVPALPPGATGYYR